MESLPARLCRFIGDEHRETSRTLAAFVEKENEEQEADFELCCQEKNSRGELRTEAFSIWRQFFTESRTHSIVAINKSVLGQQLFRVTKISLCSFSVENSNFVPAKVTLALLSNSSPLELFKSTWQTSRSAKVTVTVVTVHFMTCSSFIHSLSLHNSS